MLTVELRILGQCEIGIGNNTIKPDAPLLFMLLLYLSVESGRKVRREELVELLFDRTPLASSASHNLRQLLYRLRKTGAPIVVEPRSVIVPARLVVNPINLLTVVGPEKRLGMLSHGVAILPHLRCSSPAASRWLEAYRDREYRTVRRQLTDDIRVFRQRAAWRSVEQLAQRTLELDPLNEVATLGLAEAIARTGSKSVALSLLKSYSDEVGNGTPSLALPAQLLRRRIADSQVSHYTGIEGQLPLLGRSEEMETLSRKWQECRAGTFSVVHLKGDKSLGKTRLLDEFNALVRLDGSGTVVALRLAKRDRHRPLSMFAQISRQLVVLPGAAGCDSTTLLVLRRLDEAEVPHGPVGTAFGSSHFDDAAIRHALADLIACVTDERPVVCLVDDSQHLDEASLTVLAAIRNLETRSRILFVLASTTALTPTGGFDTELQLKPLSSEASLALLTAFSKASGVAFEADEADWSQAIAAGNPGHLELLLASDPGARQRRSVPADIIALTDERISSLTHEAHNVLLAIAVAGDGIRPSGITQVTGLPDYPLLLALQELDSSSLIFPTEEGIRCRSHFIAERIIRCASPIVIRLLHERSARILERPSTRTRVDASLTWQIAAHWKAAGEPLRARTHLRACWQQAITLGQPMTACEGIRSEMRLAATPVEYAELLDDLIGALQAAGEVVLAHAGICERAALSDQVSDIDARRASLAFDRVEAEVLSLSSPASHIESLLRHVESVALDPRRRLRASRLLVMAADTVLDLDLATRSSAFSESIAESDSVTALLKCHVALIFHTVFGNRDMALDIAAQIDSYVAKGARSWAKFSSHRNSALARQLVGSQPADYDQLERDYRDCLDAAMHTNAHQCAAYLGSLFIDEGDIERARGWISRAENLTKAATIGAGSLEYLSAQVDLGVVAGDEEHARRFLAAMQKNARKYEFGRLRNDLLLYRLRVEQVFRSATASDAELGELLHFHHVARKFGRHDDHMDVLWVALTSRGQSEKATALLARYLLVHRRERRECRHLLRKRTATDPTWKLKCLDPLRSN